MESIVMGDKKVTVTYTSYAERQKHWKEMHDKGYRIKSSKVIIEVVYEKENERVKDGIDFERRA